MSAPDSLRSPKPKSRIRRDGWTAERQLRFLDALVRSHSITKAAAFAGKSRESAHRLRHRPGGALFAALWDRILQPDAGGNLESHTRPLADGRLARLLGTHFRRNRSDFSEIGGTHNGAARR